MENFIVTFSSLMGAFSIGALVGIVVKHFLDKDRRKYEMLFEARRIAYKDVFGKLHNLFADVEGISDNSKRNKFLNSFFGEILLLSGPSLTNLIREYKTVFNEYVEYIQEFNPGFKTGDFVSEEFRGMGRNIFNLSNQIETEMRKELGI